MKSLFKIGVVIGSIVSASLGVASEIEIKIAPANSFIVPGTGVSCTSLAQAKKTGTSAVEDVTAPRAVFSDGLTLTWASADQLSVTKIHGTIDGGALSNFPFELDNEEINALLGHDFATPKQGPFVVRSSDEATKSSSFPACSLGLGNLPISQHRTAPFTSNVTIQLEGFATDTHGVVRNVNAATAATIELY